VEDLIQDLIRKYYLKKQRPSKKDFAIRVITECKARKLPVPGINTIIRRLNSLPAQLVARRRLGGKAAAKLEAFPGTFDRAKYPLAVVAIDHTKLDAIAVDEEYCLPIGRPWITLVMDVFSRMVLGYYISLDPTGGLSAGLALAHAICKKDKWLAERGIEKPWPCWGVMQCIQADNALEFHGKMLERACREYSIDLMFRRPGEPHFGGHIERKIGTLLKQVHKLPGSTFGSVPERAEYDSEGNARLTLRDLDDLIGRWIVEIHHNTIHREIKTTPLKRWTEGFFGTELTSPLRSLPAPRDEAAEGRLKLDFMPYQERSVQRAGVEAFGFRYFAEELRPWIRSKLPGSAKSRQFVFVFDPRDISRLYFFDPEVKDYFVVPFADPSKSSISIWEARAANRKLKEEGKRSVDEAMLYEAIERLRREAAEKAATSKRHRRERERMAQHAKNRGYIEPEDPEESDAEDASDQQPVKPFEVEML
jgi:putative transposase